MSATILVVEVDQGVATSICDVLVAAGYIVAETATSGVRALEIAARVRPTLALIDVDLAGPIDGIETAERLRDVGVRVVYLTDFANDETLRRAKQTVPLGYLKKPFNARELQITVELGLVQAGLETALAAREQWFATTLQSIADAVLTTDAEGRVTFLNRAAKATIGLRGSDALGKKVDEVVRLVDGRGQAVPSFARSSAVQGVTAMLPRNTRLVTASATTTEGAAPRAPRAASIEIEGSIAPIALDGGNSFGSVWVFRDVAERRQLERRLGMTERLATIGTMAAGMQHEINNPLATIVANVQFALEMLRTRPSGPSPADLAELKSALDDASEGAERVRRTVEDLRHFSNRADAVETQIEVTAAIEEAMRMTAHAVRHHATVRREYGVTPRVRADEDQLARVFMNLLLNAARATGDGAAAQHSIVIVTRTDAQGRAVVEVTDDGPGMPADVLHRIFDPFFATALDNSAMGLALAVCHSIVTSLDGEIDVESELGKGTTFRVSLPPADVAAPQSRVPRPSVMAAARSLAAEGRARILVIDDEIAIGKALHRILSKDHDVTCEHDARVALERLNRESYDVVFCDLMMPNMSGMDFFDQLFARTPALAEKIVFLTGGAFSPRSEEFLRNNRNVCLAKPFSHETVSSVVRRMMEPA